MSPHQRIMYCAKRGTGCRLTAEEVAQLSRDDAISYRAAMDDELAESGEPESNYFRPLPHER